MSIKLLKKLVNHEIKRFYVKNKLDRKDFIIDIEGEFKISFITHNYAQTRGWDNRIIIGATINKKLSKNKINYLILLYYIKKLLDNFFNHVHWKRGTVTSRNNSSLSYRDMFTTYITF